ncbi:MAG TPA: ADP-ribosylglycohydrolase family protein [Chloroflexi bacterium]|jgi:ADP-ribosylglycohydrolase|nr:ADP-ribosylglycohydrolase family protein [Chloroflexota bacterium]
MVPASDHPVAPPSPQRAIGCLLGGAVGDALGAPVEFLSLAAIRARFGPEGIRDFVPAYGVLGAITDDTQMTLFTAEGLLQALRRGRERGLWHPPTMVYHAYLRWLETQGATPPYPYQEARNGHLLTIRTLHASRAPGNTCLAALRSGTMGTPEAPLNDSKGCGGVMRAAPAGLIGVADPFALGCDVAAITHGHPSGYLAAGVLAALVAALAAGTTLREALHSARGALIGWPQHAECLAAVDAAVHLARVAPATAETVERLGAGWVAEEALAIALFAALATEDFEAGVVLAVNHGGDSDSTGAIAGNILGALLGPEAIPSRWLDALELRDEIASLAHALATEALAA